MSVLNLLTGQTETSPSKLSAVSALNTEAFDKASCDFLQALSNALLTQPDTKQHPELIALGFWLRPASIRKLHQSLTDKLHKALGLVVHYTPANVDTMFIYSWVCSLVMGNRNIVRVSSAQSQLQAALLDTLKMLFDQPEFAGTAAANQFIHYDRDDVKTGAALSALADARVLWGGDETVLAIKALPAGPRCRDISFADRHSAVVINGETLTGHNVNEVAERLYRDIHPFSQQACSSPRQVFWVGDAALQSDLLQQLSEHFTDAASISQRNEQLVMAQYLVAQGQAKSSAQYGTLSVVHLGNNNASVEMHTGNNSLWINDVANIENIAPLIDQKLQTLTYWGFEKQQLIKFLAQPSITGVDRLAPLGQALAFGTDWDGYDMLTQLSRVISVE